MTHDVVSVLPRLPELAPPKGFRKAIPLLVKLKSALRHGPVLDESGQPVTDLALIEFDHCPALQLRLWDPDTKDTIPPANDPEFIILKAKPDHLRKTVLDISAIAKTKRLTKDQIEFRRRVLAKTVEDLKTHRGRTTNKPKRKIASRPFSKGKRAFV